MSSTASTDGAPAPRRAKLLYLLPGLVFVGLAILLLARLFSGDPSKLPSALIGKPAPEFTLAPLEGLSLPGLAAADLKGRVSVVNVWASWCAPCRQEHPALMGLARDPAIRVAGINYKDNPENARRFLGALGNPFAAIGVDQVGRTAIHWGVYGVPETFIVGPDGTIRHKHIGPLTPETLPGFLAALQKARG